MAWMRFRAPGGDPLGSWSSREGSCPVELVVHGDEPLLRGPEEDGRLGAPAVGIAVGGLLGRSDLRAGVPPPALVPKGFCLPAPGTSVMNRPPAPPGSRPRWWARLSSRPRRGPGRCEPGRCRCRRSRSRPAALGLSGRSRDGGSWPSLAARDLQGFRGSSRTQPLCEVHDH